MDDVRSMVASKLDGLLARLPRGSNRLVRPAVEENSPLLACSTGSTAALRRRRIGTGVVEIAKKKKFELPPIDHSNGPTIEALLVKRPLAVLSFLNVEAALFLAGAISGALAKTATAPLDRLKVLLQVGAQLSSIGNNTQSAVCANKGDLVGAFMWLGKEEGIMGYWKGNIPQVIRVLPYSAIQLYSYEVFKTVFAGNNPESLSKVDSFMRDVVAGGAAGMFSSWVTYPLDVMRLRLAVDSNVSNSMQVLQKMVKEEGYGAFYKGLVPTLVGIAPYLALNLAIFDLVKQSMPPEYASHPFASVFAGLASATVATTACYPLDTIRRQMQMKTSTAKNVPDAIMGVLKTEGIRGLYRGFIPNTVKNLPNNSIRLATYDAAKTLLTASANAYNEEKAIYLAAKAKDAVPLSKKDKEAADKKAAEAKKAVTTAAAAVVPPKK